MGNRKLCNTVSPVSYTHLDVYKRQVLVSDVVSSSSLATDGELVLEWVRFSQR